MFRSTLSEYKDAFPKHWKNCFAIKANPTRLVLKEITNSGMGCEASSIGEIRMALRARVPPSDIVFGCPLRSQEDVEEALSLGVMLSVDNFDELEVVARAVQKNGVFGRIGVRVNPQNNKKGSLLGIGLRDDGNAALIIEAFKKYPWLNFISCHVATQLTPVEIGIQGISEVAEFAASINKEIGDRRVSMVDIGGGLPVNVSSDEVTPTFSEYCGMLKEKIPQLFDPEIFPCVISEFGRAVIAKCGFFASRVVSTKKIGGRRIAIQYGGLADFVRTAYHPNDWPLRVTILDSECNPKGGDGVDESYAESLDGGLGVTDIIGGSSEKIAPDRVLPVMSRGDIVLFHDVGGYYHAGHHTFNLRQAPSVWSYQDGTGGLELKMLQPPETVDHTLDAFCELGYSDKL